MWLYSCVKHVSCCQADLIRESGRRPVPHRRKPKNWVVTRQCAVVDRTVQSRELYQRYHRLILKLAREGQSRSGSLVRLRELLAQFELEAAGIAPDSVRFLREQLSEQLEHEALCSAHSDRRYVLFAAVKRLEQLSDRN
jgi:hypothetical protein